MKWLKLDVLCLLQKENQRKRECMGTTSERNETRRKCKKRKRERMEQAVARGNIESLDADVRFDSVSEDEEVNKLYFHLMLCFFFLLVFHRYCIRTWRNPRTLRS